MDHSVDEVRLLHISSYFHGLTGIPEVISIQVDGLTSSDYISRQTHRWPFGLPPMIQKHTNQKPAH